MRGKHFTFHGPFTPPDRSRCFVPICTEDGRTWGPCWVSFEGIEYSERLLWVHCCLFWAMLHYHR